MGKQKTGAAVDAAMLKAVRREQRMRVKKEKEMNRKLPLLGVSVKDAVSAEGRRAISKAAVRQKAVVHKEIRHRTRPIRRVKRGLKLVRFGIRRYDQMVDLAYSVFQILKAVRKK